MPTEVGRQVSFTAFDSYEKERCKLNIGMYVTKCSDAPNDYVYSKASNGGRTNISFCGMD